MKRDLFPLFTLLILFTVGCGDDDDTNPLVGLWIRNAYSVLIETNPSQTFTYDSTTTNNETMILEEDETYSSSGVSNGYPFSDSGSWSSTSDQLTIVESDYSYIDGGDGVPLIYNFSISGSTLTLIRSDTYTDAMDDEYNRVITAIYTKS
jgi:hypothetical protein